MFGERELDTVMVIIAAILIVLLENQLLLCKYEWRQLVTSDY